jgi:Tol biopolymer transport system component
MKGLAILCAAALSMAARPGLCAEARRPAVAARAVWTDPAANHLGQPSADGAHISCVDTATGDLAWYTIRDSRLRRLTHKDPKRNAGEFAYFSAISPDSRQVAYAWFNEEKFYELRVVATDGRSAPRTLFRNAEAGFVQPSAWSPDGRRILTLLFRKDNISQIAMVGAGDGSFEVLKSLSWFYPKRMDLSPDGRWIVYDALEQPGLDRRDILLLAADGAREERLVRHPSNDLYPLWSRDGRAVLFLSDRAGTLDLWAIAVDGGKAAGEPRRLVQGLGRVIPMGLSDRGDYYFALRAGGADVFEAEIDLASGELVGAPRLLPTRYRGVNSAPSFAPDGRRIAFLSVRGSENFGQEGRLVSVRRLDTGEETDLYSRLSHIESFQWSPDGRLLLVSGSDRRARGGLFIVDASSGRAEPLVIDESASFRGLEGVWDAGGKAVFYLAGNQVRHRQIDSGHEETVYRHESALRFPALSPDGGRLAFAAAGGGVFLLELAGGAVRRVEAPERGYLGALGWAPDGRHLLMTIGEEDSQTVWAVAVSTGAARRLALPKDARGTISFHPGGKRIAFSAGRPKIEIWVIEQVLGLPGGAP